MATSAFGKAFRAARDAGDKEFTFNGAKYNTRYAEEEKPQLSNKGMATPSSAKKMRDLGYDAFGNPAPLRNIPKLSNKVEKENLDEKGRIGNAIMRAEVEEAEANPRKVSTKESLSSGEEAMKRGGKVRSSASKRADGIAQKGHTKGRYM
jgi:hypothetical protein